MTTQTNAAPSRRHGPLALSRRAFLGGLPLALAGCAGMGGEEIAAPLPAGPDPRYLAMYSAMPEERFRVPAIDIRRVDERYYRQRVPYVTSENTGTIIVEPASRFLYLVQEGGQAMRYGIGVGRQGFAWNGRATIARKQAWPTWTPTQNMMEREPELREYASGMEPGLDNPLGARALYLFDNGRDTLYRIHGTNEPWSIGRAVSSGCIRLFNQDIIDLYDRVPTGSRVVVRQGGGGGGGGGGGSLAATFSS